MLRGLWRDLRGSAWEYARVRLGPKPQTHVLEVRIENAWSRWTRTVWLADVKEVFAARNHLAITLDPPDEDEHFETLRLFHGWPATALGVVAQELRARVARAEEPGRWARLTRRPRRSRLAKR